VTPKDHLDEIVRPNVRKMLTNLDDLRLAFNAVAAVDGLAAHIYWWAVYHRPQAVADIAGDSEYRRALAPRSRGFELVFETAKAMKHVRLTLGKPPSVRAADQLRSSGSGYGQGKYGAGPYGGSSQIHIEPIGEAAIPADGVIHRALEFLEQEMARLQIP
jgi:hypothetical protein